MTGGLPAFLLYDGADGRERSYALGRPQATVGRSSTADLCLGWDDEVSRVHARVELVGDDPATDWTVVDDPPSRNGSFVNGERVAGRRRLRDLDVIRMGHTVITFRAPTATAGDEHPGPEHVGDDRSDTTFMGRVIPSLAALSDSERRVLRAVARTPGTVPTTEEVARELFLSAATVDRQLQLLATRFGVADDDMDVQRRRLSEIARACGLGPDRPT